MLARDPAREIRLNEEIVRLLTRDDFRSSLCARSLRKNERLFSPIGEEMIEQLHVCVRFFSLLCEIVADLVKCRSTYSLHFATLKSIIQP